MHIYSILYSIYSSFSSKLTFKSWILTSKKKRTKLPELGWWGGGLGNSGNGRKKTFFFFEIFPMVLLSKMENIKSIYDSFIHFTTKIQFKRLFNINIFWNIWFNRLFNNCFFQELKFKNLFKYMNLAVFNSTKCSFN